MDKRKNNGGHSTKGRAGRPKKADEEKLKELMDGLATPKDVWNKLLDKVKDNDTNAIKLWLAYRYGQPKQTIESDNTHNFPTIDMNEWK